MITSFFNVLSFFYMLRWKLNQAIKSRENPDLSDFRFTFE